jgi:import receptor subunit TOM22
MVLVEEVPEEILLREGEREEDFVSDSDSDAGSIFSDLSDDFTPDETIYERLVALRDIVPPHTRSNIHKKYETTKSWTWTIGQKAASLAWMLTTSALLVGLPLALAIEDEGRIVQQEREMQMQNAGQQQVGPFQCKSGIVG